MSLRDFLACLLVSYRPLAHLSAGALDGRVGTSEGGRRKLWGLGRVDVVLVTKCIASFFGEAATLASSTYTLRLAARVPGANRARTYGVLLSLFDAGGACGAALSAALARHVVYGVWEHVPLLVMVCSALAVGPLGLLFLVYRRRRVRRPGARAGATKRVTRPPGLW